MQATPCASAAEERPCPCPAPSRDGLRLPEHLELENGALVERLTSLDTPRPGSPSTACHDPRQITVLAAVSPARTRARASRHGPARAPRRRPCGRPRGAAVGAGHRRGQPGARRARADRARRLAERGPDGPQPRGDAIDDVLARVAEPIVREIGNGHDRRFRICANDTCRWIFYDESRSGQRRWCDMATCGNRAKAQRHRARRKETGSDEGAPTGLAAAEAQLAPAPTR